MRIIISRFPLLPLSAAVPDVSLCFPGFHLSTCCLVRCRRMRTVSRRRPFGQVTSSHRAVLWRARTCPWCWKASPTTTTSCSHASKNNHQSLLLCPTVVCRWDRWVDFQNQPRSCYKRKPEDSIVKIAFSGSFRRISEQNKKTNRIHWSLVTKRSLEIFSHLSSSLGTGMSAWRVAFF